MKAIFTLMLAVAMFVLLGIGGIIANSDLSPVILVRFFAALAIVSFFSLGLIILDKLEKRPGSRKTKGANVNSHNKYTPSPLDYASSFYLGQPVVTTEEYGEGPGYHCYIDDIDRTCIGRPFRIMLLGNKGFDFVSFDEIIPDVDFENIDMEVAQ